MLVVAPSPIAPARVARHRRRRGQHRAGPSTTTTTVGAQPATLASTTVCTPSVAAPTRFTLGAPRASRPRQPAARSRPAPRRAPTPGGSALAQLLERPRATHRIVLEHDSHQLPRHHHALRHPSAWGPAPVAWVAPVSLVAAVGALALGASVARRARRLASPPVAWATHHRGGIPAAHGHRRLGACSAASTRQGARR